ncbi:NAD(P)H-quinone oxidoreductase subunit 5, chloroplastic [Dirofilaria immitis]
MITYLSTNNYKWLSPFNNRDMLDALCTQDNRESIMHHSGTYLLYHLFRHDILCLPKIQRYIPSHHIALIWFMQALQYCEIYQVLSWKKPGIQYNRTFQLLITRAAFASMCIGHTMIRLIRMNVLFQRFARNCNTLNDFAINILPKYSSFGEALSNDTYFMNLLSNYLISTINSDSRLLEIVLKTRFHLQLFSITAIKLQHQLDKAKMCIQQREKQQFILDNDENDDNNNISISRNDFAYDDEDDADESDNDKFNQCSYETNLFINAQTSAEIRKIAWFAKIGLHAEKFLLLLVLIITVILLLLLWKSYKHLSTAMILFVLNIIFSNSLFIVSFIFLLSETIDHKSYWTLDNTNFDGTLPASLIITEMLNSNLFETNKFIYQMIQETLYSLAQNGSLLGLTNLLVLVLVVMNRSMAGKSIRLSRKCVISIFSFVWIFLFITHFIFSSLQLAAIHFIGQMFKILKTHQYDIGCDEINLTLANYNIFGNLCDRISPFYNFGVYLLRGHTLFTLTFLAIALIIFAITVCYHRNVRRQNNLLNGEIREYKPQRRREILFNTLLLSICAYFISIVGQSFVEIAVFWSKNREDTTKWAQWFQLARIAAFVDPLFNPLLVIWRIPTMKSKLRWIGRYITNMILLLVCCRKRAKKKKSKQKRILASGTGELSISLHTIHSGDFIFKLLCHRNLPSKFPSSSTYRRSNDNDAIPIGCLRSNIIMNSKWNDMISCNSNISDVKSTIGTSSLSSELTIISFNDITVSSQESFDNDNIAISKQNYSKIFQVKLLKCITKKIAKDYKIQSVCQTIYEVINEQKSAKLFPTAINIWPRNTVILSNIPLSIATNEARIFLDAFMDKQIENNLEINDRTLKRIELNESKNIKQKTIQQYHETTSKKTLIFNTYPEIFRNNNENSYSNNTKCVSNFNKIIESIEREISTVESICLSKELHTEELAAGESIKIDDKKSTEMNTKDKFDETLQILEEIIIDSCKNNRKKKRNMSTLINILIIS